MSKKRTFTRGCWLSILWAVLFYAPESYPASPALGVDTRGNTVLADTCTNCTIAPGKLNAPVPVNLGGTSLATWLAHALLAGNGTGTPGLVPASTLGYLLTSNGPAADPTFQPPLSANVNYSTCASFTVTAAAGTPQGTGCTIAIPYAGMWIIRGNVRFAVSAASNLGAFITFKFRNITTGADVADSSRISGPVVSSSFNNLGTVPMESVITTVAGGIIEVYATRVNGLGTGFTTSGLVSDANGATTLVLTQQQ